MSSNVCSWRLDNRQQDSPCVQVMQPPGHGFSACLRRSSRAGDAPTRARVRRLLATFVLQGTFSRRTVSSRCAGINTPLPFAVVSSNVRSRWLENLQHSSPCVQVVRPPGHAFSACLRRSSRAGDAPTRARVRRLLATFVLQAGDVLQADRVQSVRWHRHAFAICRGVGQRSLVVVEESPA